MRHDQCAQCGRYSARRRGSWCRRCIREYAGAEPIIQDEMFPEIKEDDYRWYYATRAGWTGVDISTVGDNE